MDTVARPLSLFGSAESIKKLLMLRHNLTKDEAELAMSMARTHAPDCVEDQDLGITLRWCRVCKGYNYGPEEAGHASQP